MGATIHVLYIDDDRKNLDSVSRTLTREGFLVSTANTGTQGIAVASAEEPDVVLLDILLPDINGFDVCEALRDLPFMKRRPIIALTASTMNGDRQQSLSAGFDGYLAKPISRIELFNTIRRLVEPA